MSTSGNLYIVSAPSGAGKSSLIKALLSQSTRRELAVSVSHTTRQPRPGEVNGEHYHFVSVEQFKSMIENDDFFEWAEVFGNYYGTSKAAISDQLAQGIDVFLDIDWQGARQVKDHMPSSVAVFILPPSKDELHRRLVGRGQDSDDVISQRMDEAVAEMSHYHEFDFVLVNDDFEQTVSEFSGLIATQRLNLATQQQRNADLIKDLLAND